MSCLIVDYEDSFTYNIASELSALKIRAEVVDWKDFKSAINKLNQHRKHIIIHGPGPGHPDQYARLFPLIKESMKDERFFQVGICLGHQIFCRLWGGEILSSLKPVHGQSVSFKLPRWFDENQTLVEVQRYNSLAFLESSLPFLKPPEKLNLCFSEGELLMTQFKGGLTYQFHPESVGTSCPSRFFQPLRQFLL